MNNMIFHPTICNIWKTLIKNFLQVTLFFPLCSSLVLSKDAFCENCHSHNDYENNMPLHNALDRKYKSIEVDIVLDDDVLYVAHHPWLIRKDRLLETLYLNDLWVEYLGNNKKIYENNNTLFLLVDIKTSGMKTYFALREILKKYRPMLSKVIDGSMTIGAVTVVLSGKIPKIEHLQKLQERYIFLDGRLSNLGKNIGADLMPLISVNWKDEFNWKGKNKIKKKESNYLRWLVSRVHLENKKIRFWGAPDNKRAWGTLLLNGVDLINTDKVVELYEFMNDR
tara:strand:+ start:75 stop:917 length:843 start_codon:yes stop_codon:yes gene_type:complete